MAGRMSRDEVSPMVKYGGRVLAIALVMRVTAIPLPLGATPAHAASSVCAAIAAGASPWARLAAGPRDADVGLVIRFHQRLHHAVLQDQHRRVLAVVAIAWPHRLPGLRGGWGQTRR